MFLFEHTYLHTTLRCCLFTKMSDLLLSLKESFTDNRQPLGGTQKQTIVNRTPNNIPRIDTVEYNEGLLLGSLKNYIDSINNVDEKKYLLSVFEDDIRHFSTTLGSGCTMKEFKTYLCNFLQSCDPKAYVGIIRKLITPKECNFVVVFTSNPDALDIVSNFVKHHAHEFAEMDKWGLTHHKFDYNGWQTMTELYCRDTELPHQVFLRVAATLGATNNNLSLTRNIYKKLMEFKIMFATPILSGCGFTDRNLSSCFLRTVQMGENADTIIEECRQIFIRLAGIGMAVHNMSSNELEQFLPKLNALALEKYVTLRRPPRIAIYLEPWHEYIFNLIEKRSHKHAHGDTTQELFFAIWMPDLFMQRVENNAEWYLMCPHECPNLSTVTGNEFEKLYLQYVAEGRYKKKIAARELMYVLCKSLLETGGPYILYKDQFNNGNMYTHTAFGTIQCSNLCTEIVQYSSDTETAVCNLASISVNRYWQISSMKFNYEAFRQDTALLVRALNTIIDYTCAPDDKCHYANRVRRSIGIGVQGLADLFSLTNHVYTDPESFLLNRQVFSNLFFAALSESIVIARETKVSQPLAVIDIIRKRIGNISEKGDTNDPALDWCSLDTQLERDGVYNSVLIALMPTATTATVLGHSEGIDPHLKMYYVKNCNAGRLLVINNSLYEQCLRNGIWNRGLVNAIINKQTLDIPDHIKRQYVPARDLDQNRLIDMASDRQLYVDQAQSFNLYVNSTHPKDVQQLLINGWKAKLLTGVYYCITQPAVYVNISTTTIKQRDTVASSPCSSSNICVECSL